ncbi:AraC family transcriptional regulator [Actinoplanes derwentensis]|uniref:AraC family transcriptional regulator n=1 Tax=Actinoplanes derwentensis TaxID=113562 RepID=UPI000B89596D|nr:AraC family transcriptional regulator [Actinoplanes derwentensis]
MISVLNRLVEIVEEGLTGDFDVTAVARGLGTTEYHLRRMFSSLAGMPLSEYVRRRRMTVAAADVVQGEVDLLTVAVRHGYGSVEAFGRAFRAVHGAGPGEVRRDGGPLRSQPRLGFRLTVDGSERMDARIADRPGFRLVGFAVRVPLVHRGVNPHIRRHVAALPAAEHVRLKALGDTVPGGLLAVSDDLDPDRAEGSELTYLHGVAVLPGTPVPEEFDVIEVPAGRWVVVRAAGPHPQSLQKVWAATATEWFPSNPWRQRPGPEIVAVLDRGADLSTATCELWLPVEPAPLTPTSGPP